jgi:PAS domain S-box-containing protein
MPTAFSLLKLPLPILCIDASTLQIIEVNNAYLSAAGIPKSDIVGKNIASVFTDEKTEKKEVNKLIRSLKECAKNNTETQLQFQQYSFGSNSKQVPFVEITHIPVEDESGSVAQIIHCVDKTLNTKLFTVSDSRQTSLLNNLGGIVWEAYADTLEFTYVSPQTKRILGYTPEEWLNTPRFWENHIHPDDKAKAIETCLRETALGRDHRFEYRMIAANGDEVWIEDRVTVIRKNGKPSMLYGILIDISDIKITEEKLINTKERFKALIQEGVEMIAILNEKGLFQYVSPSFRTILGFETEELTGTDSFDNVHPEDKEKIWNEFLLLQTQEKVTSSPYRIRKKDGTYIWLQSSAFNLLNNPAVQGIVVNSLDVTANVLAQQEILDKDRKLESAQKISQLGYWNRDLHTNKIYWSDQMFEIWGKDKDTFTPTFEMFLNSVHPKDMKRFLAERKPALKGKAALNHKHRIVLDSGEIKWIHQRAKVIMDKKGKPAKFEGIVQDITHQKQEEQHLRLLESVITHSNEAVLITEAEPIDDPGPRIVFVNEAFTRLTGYKAEEVIGKSPRFLQGPKTDRIELDKVRESLEKWQAANATVINYKKNGEPFWVNFSVSPVADEVGWYTHWISIERDVTDKKREELQKSLVAKISAVFNREEDLKNCLQQVAKLISDYTDASGTEIWMANMDVSQIGLMGYYTKDKHVENFYKNSSRIKSFNPGEGLPGAVWKKNSILMWNNIDQNDLFKRYKAAKKAGLKSAVGLPLTHGDVVVGVLVLTSTTDLRNAEFAHFLSKSLGSHIGVEITRKKLEQELNQIFNIAPDIICIAGLDDGIFKRVNPVVSKLLEYDETELVSRPFIDFVHPDDHKRTFKEMESLSKGQKTFYFENRYITKSGKTVWISWTATPVVEEGLLYAIGKDVTENKKFENLLDRVTDMALIGGWEADFINNTVYWSKNAREIYEVGEDYEPTIESYYEYYKDETWKKYIEDASAKAIETGNEFDIEFPIITAKNKEKWIRVKGKPEYQGSNCVGMIGSIQDIHVRKTTEIALSNKSRFLEALSDIVSLFLKEEDWQTALEKSFKITGETVKADRVYFFENHLDHNNNQVLCSQRHEWCANGVEPQIDDPILQNVPHEAFPEFVKTLADGNAYNNITKNIREDSTRILLENQGIKSILVLPIIVNKSFWGFIGFDECGYEREWTEEEISFLSGITSNLAAAIQRVQNTIALKKANEEKSEILESIGDGFFTTDSQGIITYWNHSAEKTIGIKRRKILGKNIWEIFNDIELTDFYRKAFNTKEPIHFDEFYPGINRWLEISVYPSSTGISVYFRDITKQKEAQKQIEETNERFEIVSQATNDAIWDWDMKSDLIFWGQGFQTHYGYNTKKEGVSLDSWFKNIHPDDLESVEKSIGDALQNNENSHWKKEYRFKKKDGTIAYVIDRGMIMRDSRNKPSRIVGAMTDITHRREYEESLKELNEELETRARELAATNVELEQFAYVASHDLQEPLRMVTGFMSRLESKYKDRLDEKALRYIHFATDGAKRMRQIILDLLEYSRAGKYMNDKENIDIQQLVDEACMLNRKTIDEKKAIVKTTKLPVIKGHYAPVLQILQNLISNALKYSKKGTPPKIEISCSEHKTHWQFSVKDNGIGIDAEYHDKVFIIFQRLHNKDEYSGTGMGLAIVKKIVENLGGEIWVDSQKNKGTTFHFTIEK